MTPTNLSLLALTALALLAPTDALAQGKTMLVFTSGETERSTTIVETFKTVADFDATKLSFDLGASEEEAYFVAESLQGMEASLIFAVGDTALKVAAREFRGIPIIYADARAATAAAVGRTDILEVEQRADPKLTIERLMTLMPSVDTVGAIYSVKDRSPYWDQMEAAAAAAGIDFVTARVANPDEVPNAQTGLMAEAQWIVIQRDGRLWTPATLSRLFHDAQLSDFPIVTYSVDHLDSPQPPALVMISDAAGLGEAAARMARAIIVDGTPVAEVEPAYPAPIVIGDKGALARGHVRLTKKTTAAVDDWRQ